MQGRSPSGGRFDPPIRVRLDDGVGIVRTVAEAIDWIDNDDRLAVRLQLAMAALRRARETGSASDLALARSALSVELARQHMLLD